MPGIFSSNDLLKLGYEEDELLHEDPSLCGMCSITWNGCHNTTRRPLRQ